jgi:hypothetical protein
MGQAVMYWQILSKQPAKLAEFYDRYLDGTFGLRMRSEAAPWKRAAARAFLEASGRFPRTRKVWCSHLSAWTMSRHMCREWNPEAAK